MKTHLIGEAPPQCLELTDEGEVASCRPYEQPRKDCPVAFQLIWKNATLQAASSVGVLDPMHGRLRSAR
jgi:hypothetical protein